MKEPIKTSPNADERLSPQVKTDPVKTEETAPGATEDAKSDEDQSSLGEAIDRGFEAWLAARLSNSVLSRNTEAWNLIRKEKGRLKDFILKEVQ